MLKKRWGKKGDWEIWLIILQPLIIMGFLAAFGLWIYDFNESTILEKMYYSRDIALTTTAVAAAPADFYFTYSGGAIKKFNYTFGDRYVAVGQAGTDTKYIYADDRILDKSGLKGRVTPWVNSLEYSNVGEMFEVDTSPAKTQKFKIGYLDTTDKHWERDKKIVLKGEHEKIQALRKPPTFVAGHSEPDIYFELKEPTGSDLIAYIDFETAEKSRKLAVTMINKLIFANQGKVGLVRIYFTDEIPKVKEAGVILEKGKKLRLIDAIEVSFGEFYG